MIKWIFFDIGSTLIDESLAYEHRAQDMLRESDITIEKYNQVSVALAIEGLDGHSAAILYFGLTKTPWHSEDELPYPDAHSTLSSLSERGYRLGIIANQNPGLRERLEKWGILRFFDVVVSSSEVGCAKPDSAIFEKALKAVGCTPCESVMVGDRLDNDMRPAKAIGMKTVWIKNGLAKYQSKELGAGVADYQVGSLSELLLIF